MRKTDQLNIKGIDQETIRQLRIKAAQENKSMSELVREKLTEIAKEQEAKTKSK